jgi:WS/DGAT/MGAT family acyltransferase
MIDGQAGANIAQILFSPSPDHEITEPEPWVPRPAPGDLELVIDAAERFAMAPFRAMRGLADLVTETEDLGGELRARAKALRDFVGWGFTRSTRTPLNGELCPHRRVDWLSLPLAQVKEVGKKLDCTINDIVLATVTGAVRHYLIRRGVRPALTDFRISAPVSTRGADEEKMGNRVSAWIVRLPIEHEEPLDWVEGVRTATEECKSSRQALGVEMMMQAAEYAPAGLMSLGARLASGPINMIVTNVRGPQFPLYMLGAKLREFHPLVPLLDGTGLGIALMSYDGRFHVGLNADYELVPDLGIFTALFAQAFMTLADEAGVEVGTEDEVVAAETAAANPSERTGEEGTEVPVVVVRAKNAAPRTAEIAISASGPSGPPIVG